MFERHILFKCHDAATAPTLARQTRVALTSGAPAEHTSSEHTSSEHTSSEHTFALWLGLPADAASARAWDLALRATFADGEALNRWLASAEFAHWHRHVAEPACVVIKAWSFGAL